MSDRDVRKRKRRIMGLSLLLVILFLTACDNAEFKKQIGEFQKAIGDSRLAIEAYYLEMNQFERDIYLLRRELDAKQDLAVIYAHETPEDVTLIVNDKALYINGPFSSKSIQARLDAIKLIGLYGSRLAELAGTNAPAAFETETAALGGNIVNLAQTFQELAGTGKDAGAAAFAGPVGKLVGVVGRLFLERKRDKALISAIKEATPQITGVTAQLNRDFVDVVNPQRRIGIKATLALLVNFYNDERIKAGSNRNERKKTLAEINDISRKYELLTASNPQAIVQGIEGANQALLAYANSGRKDADFTQLVAQIGEFRDRAKEIAEAIKEIRAIERRLKDEN